LRPSGEFDADGRLAASIVGHIIFPDWSLSNMGGGHGTHAFWGSKYLLMLIHNESL
jgi:hypothetical protein